MERLILILILSLETAASGADYYVATTGNDSTGDGSIGNPWKTLQKATDATPGTVAQHNVWLRGGNYFNTTLFIGSFANSNYQFSSYQGESAILYGGQLLTGWSAAGSNGPNGQSLWVASLPVFPTIDTSTANETTWEPRSLLANGVSIPRAKDPATGTGTKYFYSSFSGTTLVYTNTFVASTNGEIQADASWTDAELNITAINTGTKTITTSAALDRSNMGGEGDSITSFTMLNTPQGMTLPEQFWWNKTNNSIIYAGTDPSVKTMIIPTCNRMILAQGLSNLSLTNVVFSNLTFACTTVPISSGVKDDVGSLYLPAIDFYYTTNGCAVKNCTVFGCAGQAIGNDNSHPASVMLVTGCTIHDIGVGGIVFPGTTGVTISSNNIYNCGNLCQAGAGIVGFNAANIAGNTISNIIGAGIWVILPGGGPKNTNVVIQGNKVIRAAQQLRDFGGIYSVMTTNLTIIGNVVAEVYSAHSNFFNWSPANSSTTNWNALHGIYCDYGTDHATVISNIVYNCTSPLIHHLSSNNIIKNNYWINLRTGENTEIDIVNSTNSPPVFTNNIYYVSSGVPYVNGEDGSYNPYSVNTNVAVSNWTGNIVWSASANNGYNPTNATTADPQFVSLLYPKQLQFSGGTASGLGIQPLTFFNDTILSITITIGQATIGKMSIQ
jgi:hypothetical protein